MLFYVNKQSHFIVTRYSLYEIYKLCLFINCILLYQQTGQCVALVFLKEITAVARSELKSHCFELGTKAKSYYIACRNDEELYSWMDEIYNVSLDIFGFV